MAQPPYRLACPRRNGSDRKPRLAAPELPYASASPGVDRGETASFTGRLKGLSCLRGNSHEQFSRGGTAVTPSCYPAKTVQKAIHGREAARKAQFSNPFADGGAVDPIAM